jgi:hypothetical protein
MVEWATRSSCSRIAWSVDVAPQRGDAVDVAPSLRVHEVGALATLDHHGLFVAPVALLGERVPEVTVVELADGRRGRTE